MYSKGYIEGIVTGVTIAVAIITLVYLIGQAAEAVYAGKACTAIK